LPHTILRSGFCAFILAATLGGCVPNNNLALPTRSSLNSPASTPAPVVPASPRPGLIVSDAPAPEVIYRPGSRNAVLSSGSGATTNYSPVNTQHIETPITQKARELSHELAQLRKDTDNAGDQLQQLQARNNRGAADYYAAVAAVSAELQGGSTPGNPILVDRWNIAQEKLTALEQDSGLLNNLSTDLNNQATHAAYMLEATQNAFSISGAVPEDHKKLAVVQDGIEQDLSVINRLLGKTNDEVAHHTTFLQSERANLQTLSLGIANGELYGTSLTNSLFRKATGGDSSLFRDGTPPVMGKMSASGVPGPRKPLVIIRFDRPGVNYDQPLYTAVSQALDKYPAARFDLIAVSNLQGNAAELALSSAEARKNGEAVLRSLQGMGVPMERIRLSAANSKKVLNSEVHLYLQ
jgi:hypothetical protein